MREITPTAEAVLLGRMIEGDDPDFVTDAVTALSPTVFTTTPHRAVFTAITQVFQAGAPVDLPTVVEQLRTTGGLDVAGGVGAVSGLTATSLSASAAAPRLHLTALADVERTRRLHDGLANLLAQAQDGRLGSADELQARITDLFDASAPALSSLVPMPDRVSELQATMQRRLDAGDGFDGVPTGWKDLDGGKDSMAILRGLKPGWLVLLAARPGSGKTTSLIDWVRAACASGKGVVLFSLEQPAEELTEQIVVAETGNISRGKFSDPAQLSEGAWDKISGAMARVAGWPLVIDDTARTLPQMRRVAAEARRQFQADGIDLDIVFQDFIQLTEPTPDMTGQPRHQQLSDMANGLKAMAKDLAIPVIAAAQLNRDTVSDDRYPRMTDLKSSGGLEEAADVAILLHRPYANDAANSTDTPDHMQVIVGKNRHGRTGGVFSRSFLGEFSRTSEPIGGIPTQEP